MSDYVKCSCGDDKSFCPDCYKDAVATFRESESILRNLLWLRHGCSITSLYGDDGEMQCGTCGIDFKRMDPASIRTRFYQLGVDALARRESNV